MRRLLSPVGLAAAGLVLLGAVAAVLALTPTGGTYIFLPDQARPVEPLVHVEGERAEADGGRIYFVNILVRKATLAERLFPRIREGSTLVPASHLNPTGESEDVRRRGSLREMTRSQRIAAAVALRQLGYPVRARATGALVEVVLPDRPAARRLHAGDVVVSVDGRPVRSPDDLRRLIRRSGGRAVSLRVRADGRERTLRLTPVRERGRLVLGIHVGPAVDIRLPIRVEIDSGNVGGPSAGLAFALALLEKLGRDVDRGREVAVTGELALDGTVLPVGGLRQKTIGARRTGVDVFVVPAGENAREARREARGLRILPVRTFQQALRALTTRGSDLEMPAKAAFPKSPEIATVS